MILTLKSIVEHAGFAYFIYNLAYKEYDPIIIIWNNGENKGENYFHSLWFSSIRSVTQSYLTLYDLMDCSMPDFSVHHQLPELTQTHVHQVSDAIQPSHSLSSPSPLALSLSQHEGLFKWISWGHIQIESEGLEKKRYSNESAISMRWPKYWSFSFSISPSNEYSGLISFRIHWFHLLAVQGTLKSLLQHHSSKASILWGSAFFIVQLSNPYMTTGKTIAFTRRTFVRKVMSLFFNILSRLVIAFLPRSKHLLISWLQSPSAVILEPAKIKSVTVSIDFASVWNECNCEVVWAFFGIAFLWDWNENTFSSYVSTAEFSRFAGILSPALSQHHLLGFEIAQLEFHHLH